MADPDILGSPAPYAGDGVPFDEQVRRAAARSRRWRRGGVIGAVVALGTAAVLASRAIPGAPPDAPVVTAAPSRSDPPDRPTGHGGGVSVIDVAIGRRQAYALLGSCEGPDPAQRCAYRLVRQPNPGGRWQHSPLPLPPPADGDGFSARLLLARGDMLTVLDDARGRAYVSTDGVRFSTRRLTRGPSLADVPAGLTPELHDGLVVVVDPATGQRRPLATQPRLGAWVGSLGYRDGVLWAAGDAGRGVVTGVSTDQGRSWRLLPVPGPGGLQQLQVIPIPGGGAYLLGGRDDRPEVRNEFSELWRLDDPTRPGARWSRVRDPRWPPSASSVVALAGGDLLVTDEISGAWRVAPDGVSRLPEAYVGGSAVAPGHLVAGPDGTLLGRPAVELGEAVLLVSRDQGESWQVEVLPG